MKKVTVIILVVSLAALNACVETTSTLRYNPKHIPEIPQKLQLKEKPPIENSNKETKYAAIEKKFKVASKNLHIALKIRNRKENENIEKEKILNFLFSRLSEINSEQEELVDTVTTESKLKRLKELVEEKVKLSDKIDTIEKEYEESFTELAEAITNWVEMDNIYDKLQGDYREWWVTELGNGTLPYTWD